MGVMTPWRGQIGEVDVEVLATLRTVMRGVGDEQINGTMAVQIAYIVQGAVTPFVAISQMTASRTGGMLMVAIIGHDLRRWKITDINDPFGGIGNILAGSEPHGEFSSEKVEPAV
jgi:hypothetical protein